MSRMMSKFGVVGVAMALALVLAGGALVGQAQDSTPVAGDVSSVPHPAHIHEGNCETLNPTPLLPLADVEMRSGMDMDMASPAASPMAMGTGSMEAMPAAVSVTTVAASLDVILSAEHAINVHESAENAGNYIACGAIGGTPDSDGNLFIGLAEQNGSGFSGVAWLQGTGEETIVTVFLAQGLSGGVSTDATPVS
ncbi:MAG: hypothetical protein WKF80_00315 [Thermomicrobiales bacterium]